MLTRMQMHVDIAKVGVRESLTRNTTVVGEDTDLLILLLYYIYSTSNTDFKHLFRSDTMKNKKQNKIHDILKYRGILDHELFCHLLFVHAFTGCDTTSAFYEKELHLINLRNPLHSKILPTHL